MFEHWDGSLQRRDKTAEEGEGDAPGRDAGELDDGEGNRLGESIENGFGRCVCKCGAHVPHKAENLDFL